jgi:hypothetical protein
MPILHLHHVQVRKIWTWDSAAWISQLLSSFSFDIEAMTLPIEHGGHMINKCMTQYHIVRIDFSVSPNTIITFNQCSFIFFQSIIWRIGRHKSWAIHSETPIWEKHSLEVTLCILLTILSQKLLRIMETLTSLPTACVKRPVLLLSLMHASQLREANAGHTSEILKL